MAEPAKSEEHATNRSFQELEISGPETKRARCVTVVEVEEAECIPETGIVARIQQSSWFRTKHASEESNEDLDLLHTIQEIEASPVFMGISDQENIDNFALVYSRRVYFKSKPEERIRIFENLIDPTRAKRDDRYNFRKVRKRILALLAKGEDIFSDLIPHGIQTFDDVVTILTEWSESSAYVFHQDEEITRKFESCLVQRVQTVGSTTCYAQAAIVALHYLVVKACCRGSPKPTMIDFSSLIQCLDATELEESFIGLDTPGLLRAPAGP